MKIFTFFGADSKVGVTMVSKCAAEMLASMYINKKVLLLHLDGHTGMEYTLQDNECGLDTIKSALLSNVLTQEELMGMCIAQGNLSELKGTCNYAARRDLYPEHARRIIEKADADVIMVDAGSNFEMGLSIGALQFSDYNFLVTTQKRSALDRFTEVNWQILSNLNITFKKLIVNKYMNHIKLEDIDCLKKVYEIPAGFTLPVSDYTWQADQERDTLLQYKDVTYKNGIEEIAEHIAVECGYLGPMKSERNEKKGVFRWMRK